MDRAEGALRVAELALAEARRAQRELAELRMQRTAGPPGPDGTDGKDGRDGLGFDDMTEELADDGRTIVRRYTRGDEVKEFRHTMAVVLDRGVYRAGETYVKGDAVTFGGSLWIAQEETNDKPEGGKGWRLSVKKGRDGRDGVVKYEGPPKPVKVG